MKKKTLKFNLLFYCVLLTICHNMFWKWTGTKKCQTIIYINDDPVPFILFYIKRWRQNPSGTKMIIFLGKLGKNIAPGALSICGTKTSATMVLIVNDQILFFHKVRFYLPTSSQCTEIMENGNTILCFLKIYSPFKVLTTLSLSMSPEYWVAVIHMEPSQ